MAVVDTPAFAPDSLGTWVWDTADILFSEKTVEFLDANHVTEAYLSYSRALPTTYYRAFIKACAHRGIRASVIGAETDWALPSGQRGLQTFLAWLTAYQAGCGDSEERFYGIHLDVEPHQLELWRDDERRAEAIAEYYNMLCTVRETCDALGVLLEADIPFWFDGFAVEAEGREMPLSEAVIRLCDTTLLMTYRDNAETIYACAQPEMSVAGALGKKLVLAVETGKVYEDVNITFFHMGTSAMYRELNKLKAMVEATPAAGEVGYAIHHYGSWETLPENGWPIGPDYPY